jgi:hypothetical protein
MTQLAKELGISDKGLAKKCIKHLIPRPPKGYWARVNSGQTPKKTSLSKINNPALETVFFTILDRDSNRLLSESYQVEENLLAKARKFSLLNSVKKFHPIIRESRNAKLDYFDKYGRVIFNRKVADLGLKVTDKSYSRACYLLESFVRFCESVGWRYEKRQLSYSRRECEAVFTDGQVHLRIEIKEEVKQVDHIPGKKDRQDTYWSQKYDFLATGHLKFSILGPSDGYKTVWQDNKKLKVEDGFVAIIESFDKSFECARLLKIKRKQEDIEREKQAAIRKEKIRQEEALKNRTEQLLSLSDKHQKAESIRTLLTSINYRYGDQPEVQSWLKWAESVAESMDPVCNFKSILEEYKKFEQGTQD